MHVEVLCEEESGYYALSYLVPAIAPDVSFDVHFYRGWPDLKKKVKSRLRGFANSHPKYYGTDWVVVVLADEDRADCIERKAILDAAARDAQLVPLSDARTQSPTPDDVTHRFHVVNRIAVEELEAWFFGDEQAVMAAFPGTAPFSNTEGFRVPDAVGGGTAERLAEVLGIPWGEFVKTETALEIASHMDPSRNTSQSFQAFRDALQMINSLA